MRIVKTIVFDKYDMNRFNSLTDIEKKGFLEMLVWCELDGRFIEVSENFYDYLNAICKHGLLAHIEDDQYMLTNTYDYDDTDSLYMGVECSDGTDKFIAEHIFEKTIALKRAVSNDKDQAEAME